MRTKATLIVVCGLAMATSLLVSVSANSQRQGGASLQAAARIVRTREVERSGREFVVTTNSLGSWIAPGVLLTHNHFNPPLGAVSETIAIVSPDGRTTTFGINQLTWTAVDAETQLIYAPMQGDGTVALLADPATIRDLVVGASLDVVISDLAAGTLSQRALPIVSISRDTVVVFDEARVIRPGNSGGGAYYQGRLVGNVRSYNATQQGNPMGTANVTLLPEVLLR